MCGTVEETNKHPHPHSSPDYSLLSMKLSQHHDTVLNDSHAHNGSHSSWSM